MMDCAFWMPPAQEVAIKTDYGFYPSNYEEIVTSWINESVDIPLSVCELVILPPEKFDLEPIPAKGGSKTYCYKVQFAFNEKRSTGHWVGKLWYKMLIRNGATLRVWGIGEM
jgi:hypothetical protein